MKYLNIHNLAYNNKLSILKIYLNQYLLMSVYYLIMVYWLQQQQQK